ncbi:TetR/AcrR family transcriptional regulator [Nakamurella antarctica]|uniref:TetR/AcrR family transcriptional regulator n=1 Tax=Nakamurella antarctica TaxID=1902245 RepID=A0A3G8ZUH8_9ACTN|nr:TetR/AcrR family transcriptional regulator [Nakamurella antarctica]AZI58144.1 TetR/AcrR family transcriptional regulator [Nakamurella antarctica]
MTEQFTRATPRLNRAARRAQLLSAAKSAFVSQGYHCAAMDDIADRAGVSKPVLYQHFPSKLELYLALLSETADELVAALRAAINETDDNDVRVHRAVEAIFRYVGGDSQGHRLVFESDLAGQPEVDRIVDHMTEACVGAITETITNDTGVDTAHGRLLAAGLVGLSQVSARYWLAQSGEVPQEEAVEMVYTLAWRGISRFPRQIKD